MEAQFVCWHCGKEHNVDIPAHPQFAFQLVKWARDVGLYGVMDMRYGRALIFCNEEHADHEKTKAGYFRARAKGLEQAQNSAKGDETA